MDRNSFYPAAQRVVKNPIVKWLAGGLFALVSAAVTTGIWPWFKGWAATRADTESVQKVEVRVGKIETAHQVDFKRLNSALGDDTGALSQGEQLQWALIRIKRMETRLVRETRSRIGLEAAMRMPNPRSDAAQRIAASVRAKFDDLMFKGETAETAAQKALEAVYGSEDDRPVTRRRR